MRAILKNFISDDSGATAIEYGLIAALIAVVIITALTTIGTKLTATFNSVVRLAVELSVALIPVTTNFGPRATGDQKAFGVRSTPRSHRDCPTRPWTGRHRSRSPGPDS